MALRDLVIQSQLIPPRQRKGVLRRPRLEARLEDVLDYPLTLVQAGTGYGKSGEGYIRLSLTVHDAALVRGLSKLSNWRDPRRKLKQGVDFT